MERPCYRCGTQIEEHTTFCPSCGAPQIKVAVRGDASGNEPATPPLPQGTPDSIQPPSVPVKPDSPSGIRWKRFWRFALPLAVASGVAIKLLGWLGVILFLVSLIIAINAYRSDQGGPLRASQGVWMGALTGLVSYAVVLTIDIVQALRDFGDFRQQWVQNVQQRLGSNPDPQVQQLAHWAVTNHGIIVLTLLSAVITAVFVVVFSGIVGALTASMSGKRS